MNVSEDDLLVLSDEGNYQLQGAKLKEKAERLLTTEEPVMKYIPRPPMKSQEPQELMSASVGTYRGKKNLSHTSSAPSPFRSPTRISSSLASSSPRKLNSAPGQMLSAFRWPAILGQIDHEKSCIEPQSVQSSLCGMSGKLVDNEVGQPHSLPLICRPESAKKSHANPAYKEWHKGQEDEPKKRTSVMERCKDASGLPPKHILVMKADQRRSDSASQQRDSKMPNVKEVSGRETKKAVNNDKVLLCDRRGKKLACLSISAPSPRRPSSGTSPTRAFPSPRTANSAPVQKLSAFQWPVIEEQTEFDSTLQSPKVLSRVLEKTMNLQGLAGSADVVEYRSNNDVATIFEDKLKVSRYVHDKIRRSSPDSFVAQLIANSKHLTLYDSVESPTLQERKKKALGKKFG